MKNLPDLGIVFVITMAFWMIFYLVDLALQRFEVHDIGIEIMLDGFISALVLYYWLDSKDKEIEDLEAEKHRIISYWEKKEMERQKIKLT